MLHKTMASEDLFFLYSQRQLEKESIVCCNQKHTTVKTVTIPRITAWLSLKFVFKRSKMTAVLQKNGQGGDLQTSCASEGYQDLFFIQ